MRAGEFVAMTSMLLGWLVLGLGHPVLAFGFGLWGLFAWRSGLLDG